MKYLYIFIILFLSNAIHAQCSLSNSAFVGDYDLVQVTPIHSINGVQSFEDQVIKLKHDTGDNKRKFSAIYLEALGIAQPPTEISFTLDCNNVVVDTDLETGLTCTSSSSITLGPADTTGTFNSNDDSSFSLILEEYVDDGGCGVTTPIITEFMLTKKDCSTPQNLSISDIDNTTAMISWDDFNGSNTTFEVEYGLANFTLGSGTKLSNLNTPNVTLENLQADVFYSFYITTFCGNTNSQVTSGPFGLSVPEDCDIIFSGLPIDENFENAETFDNCYTVLSEDANDSSWGQLEFFFNNTSYFAINYPSEIQKEDYLFTPEINMTAGKTYNISFLYNAVDGNQGDANENLEVLVVQDTTVTSVNNAISLFNDTGITQNGDFNSIYEQALEGSTSFEPLSSGVYHLVFKSTGSPKPQNQTTGHLLLFEYGINEINFLSLDENEILNLNYYVNNLNQLILSANQAFDKISLFNLLGQQALSQKLSAQDESIDLNSLTSGVYLVKVQIGDSSKTFKIVNK